MDEAAETLFIREYAPSDLDRLHKIRTAAFAPVFASFRDIVGGRIAPHAFAGEEEEQGRHLEQICSAGVADRVYVAILGERIAGFVTVSLDRDKRMGEIGLNAVDPELAGRGIGTALYRFAFERMREAGMKAAMVGTGGDPSHGPARRAYEKAGFDRTLPTLWLYREL